MAVRKPEQNDESKELETTSVLVEQRVGAFAEQLGQWVSTVQAKAEGWLDRKTLSKAIGRIRDSAADLVEQLNRKNPSERTTAATRTATAAARPTRGPVNAPGKRHRKPLPEEAIDKRMGEPRGKQMGQKSAKNSPRGGRR
jgi:hypothetical protein